MVCVCWGRCATPSGIGPLYWLEQRPTLARTGTTMAPMYVNGCGVVGVAVGVAWCTVQVPCGSGSGSGMVYSTGAMWEWQWEWHGVQYGCHVELVLYVNVK